MKYMSQEKIGCPWLENEQPPPSSVPARLSIRGLAGSRDSEGIQDLVALEQWAQQVAFSNRLHAPAWTGAEGQISSQQSRGLFITPVSIWESESGSRIQNPSPRYKIQAPGDREMK